LAELQYLLVAVFSICESPAAARKEKVRPGPWVTESARRSNLTGTQSKKVRVAMRYRIAVIDVHKAFLHTLQQVLEEQGYEVGIVETPANAYAQLRAWKPHLLLLDLRLGAADGGLHLLSILRCDPTLATLPAIVCSADIAGLRAHHETIRRLDARSLEKPFGLAELCSLLEELLPSEIGNGQSGKGAVATVWRGEDIRQPTADRDPGPNYAEYPMRA